MYQDGRGFVPDTITNGTVAILAQNPGSDEERGQRIVGYHGPRNPMYEPCTPQPLIGATGYLLRHTYIPLSTIPVEQYSFHNILKCRWRHSNALPDETIYQEAAAHCTQAHLTIPETAQVVVAHGAAAWEWTQRETIQTWYANKAKGSREKFPYGITNWRGFIGPDTLSNRYVYATIHGSDLLRDPHQRFIARFDWKRLGRVVRAEWPQAVPPRTIAAPATRGDFVRALDASLQQPAIMVDTEFIPERQLLTHIGAAWKTADGQVTGWQLEWIKGQATNVERGIFMRYWPQLCEKVTMGFWHAKADLPIIEHNLHHIPIKVEDPMYAHAVLWPDMDHDYEFVASIYGKYNKLKHLAKSNILLYHWGDMIDMVWIWEALKQEFKHDPMAEQRYRQQMLPLIPILLESEKQGLRVNHARIESARPQYQALIDTASQLGNAFVGCPINLGSSKQVLAALAERGVKLKSIDKDKVAEKRAKYLPFDADYEEQHGFSLEYVMDRIEQGAHPLLELRVMYAKNSKIVSDYLDPFDAVDRFFVEINTHTQAGGRHSVSRLGTVPPELLDIVLPDANEVFISFDWDAQEPRIQAAESGSKVLKAAFDEGEDIHTTFVCQLYGWPLPKNRKNPHTSVEDAEWRTARNWQGKDDPRRVFAKTTRYEINYGGDGTQAAKKAIRMGIDPQIAKRAAQVLLQSDPELSTWFRKVEKEVEHSRIIRSWDGGRRVFYWVDSGGQVAEMKRQARNFPPQGGGAGLHNLTIVEIARTIPDVKYAYGRHDSQCWRMPAEGWEARYEQIKHIATQPRLINKTMVNFPATFKMEDAYGTITKL